MTGQSWRKTAIRFGVLILGLLFLDGCLNRDPYVEVTGGYAIVAISPGSPCILWYSGSRDSRSYSDWIAHALVMESESDILYSLSRTGPPDEVLDFKSVQEWRIARREKNAQPARSVPRADRGARIQER